MLLGGFAALASTALVVVQILALWKIFVKAGQPGWKCIIPAYGTYTLFKIACGNGWIFLFEFLPGLFGMMCGVSITYTAIIGTQSSAFASFVGVSTAVIVVSIIVGIVIPLALSIWLHFKLSDSFGKSEGFKWGMIIVDVLCSIPVFTIILGFDQSSYNGPSIKKEEHE